MDSKFLRSLILVVERGSIAEAARAEHLTAAAIGQRISSLESELGCTLLTRAGRRSRPTQACLNLLPRARAIVAEVEQLSGDVDQQGLSGSLHMGVVSSAMSSYLPMGLKRLRELAPQVHLTITPGTSRQLYDAILAGQLDAAIIVEPPFAVPKSLSWNFVHAEPLCFMSGSGEPPQHLQDVRQKVRDSLYIRYDPQSWGGRLAQDWAEENALEQTLLCDMDGPETISQMVSDGMGVSLLPLWPALQKQTAAEGRQSPLHIFVIGEAAFARRIGMLAQHSSDKQRLIETVHDCILSDLPTPY